MNSNWKLALILMVCLMVCSLFVISCEETPLTNSKNELVRSKCVGSYEGYDIVKVTTTDHEGVYLAFNRNNGNISTKYSRSTGKASSNDIPVIIINDDTVSLDSAKNILKDYD